MASENIKRSISIFINDKEVKNSLGGIGREIGKIKRAMKESTDSADMKKLNTELGKAQQYYADIKDELIDTNGVLEEAGGHFSNLFSGIVTGDFKKIQSGLQGISGNIKGLTKAGLAFIATPIGLAIAALAGIGFATKQWIDFNLQVYESNKLVKELTNQSGDAVDAIRIRAEVLEETFDIGFNQSINNAKSLVKGFGISYDEAFNLIEDSAVTGKTKNEEFFASLKEYPIQFKNAGYSASEFVRIINTGIDLSIYQDKLPDAIKEANLAISEQTAATKDALINSFGSVFTDDLLKKVSSGELTTKQALQTIAAESEKVNLNQQQQAQLTADLFKGAGEDAGGSLKIFEALNIALNEQQKPLTKSQELTKQQLELNKELNGVYTQLFASGNEGFGNWIKKGKIFATEILLEILKGGVDVYNWFVELNNSSSTFSAILKGIGKSSMFGIEISIEAFKLLWNQIKSVGTLIEGIFTFDPGKIKQAFSDSFSNIGTSLTNLKNKAVDNANDIYDAFQGKNKFKKIDLNSLLASDTSATTTDTTKTPEDKLKADAFLKAEEEINKLIKKKQAERILNQKKGLEKELAQIAANYDALEEKYKGHTDKLEELELLKQQEINDAKLAKKQEYLDLEAQIEEENRLAKEEALYDREIEKAETDEEKSQILLEKIKFLADEELRIEEEKELAKIESVEGAEALKDAIRNKYKLKKEKADATYIKGKEKADKAAVETEKTLNAQRTQEYANMFGDIASLLGRNTAAGKAAAIAQATINTYQGISNVWAEKAETGFVGAGLFQRIATSAIVLATGIKNIKSIKGTKTPSFYYGGSTGDKAIGYDEYGKQVGVVHDNEWVAPKIMTQNPKYAANFTYLEAERKRLTKGYFNGGVGESTNSTSDVAFDEDSETATLTTTKDQLLIEALNRNSKILEKIDETGVVAFMSNNLKNGKLIKESIEDYEALTTQNKI